MDWAKTTARGKKHVLVFGVSYISSLTVILNSVLILELLIHVVGKLWGASYEYFGDN